MYAHLHTITVFVHMCVLVVCMCVQSYQSKNTLLLSNHCHLPPSKILHNDSHAGSSVDKGRKSTKYTLESFSILELLCGGIKYNLHKQEREQTHDLGELPQYKDRSTNHFDSKFMQQKCIGIMIYNYRRLRDCLTMRPAKALL